MDDRTSIGNATPIRSLLLFATSIVLSLAATNASIADQGKERLRSEALGGSANSAYLLSQREEAENNVVDALFWLRLSAELGSCDAIRDLHIVYRNKQVPPEWLLNWKMRLHACERSPTNPE
jgi:hypothetical protein